MQQSTIENGLGGGGGTPTEGGGPGGGLIHLVWGLRVGLDPSSSITSSLSGLKAEGWSSSAAGCSQVEMRTQPDTQPETHNI